MVSKVGRHVVSECIRQVLIYEDLMCEVLSILWTCCNQESGKFDLCQGVKLEALAPADVSVELVCMKSVNDQSVKGLCRS